MKLKGSWTIVVHLVVVETAHFFCRFEINTVECVCTVGRGPDVESHV